MLDVNGIPVKLFDVLHDASHEGGQERTKKQEEINKLEMRALRREVLAVNVTPVKSFAVLHDTSHEEGHG